MRVIASRWLKPRSRAWAGCWPRATGTGRPAGPGLAGRTTPSPLREPTLPRARSSRRPCRLEPTRSGPFPVPRRSRLTYRLDPSISPCPVPLTSGPNLCTDLTRSYHLCVSYRVTSCSPTQRHFFPRSALRCKGIDEQVYLTLEVHLVSSLSDTNKQSWSVSWLSPFVWYIPRPSVEEVSGPRQLRARPRDVWMAGGIQGRDSRFARSQLGLETSQPTIGTLHRDRD